MGDELKRSLGKSRIARRYVLRSEIDASNGKESA